MKNEQYLTFEEAESVDRASLSIEEKFLTRITISSLRMLQKIASSEDVKIEDLTPAQIITWFEKDSKIKTEQGTDAANLKW